MTKHWALQIVVRKVQIIKESVQRWWGVMQLQSGACGSRERALTSTSNKGANQIESERRPDQTSNAKCCKRSKARSSEADRDTTSEPQHRRGARSWWTAVSRAFRWEGWPDTVTEVLSIKLSQWMENWGFWPGGLNEDFRWFLKVFRGFKGEGCKVPRIFKRCSTHCQLFNEKDSVTVSWNPVRGRAIDT